MQFKKFNPQGKSCIIKPYEIPKVSAGGMTWKHDSNTSFAKVRGTILEASIDSKYFLLVGREVLFRRYSTDEYKWVGPKGEEIVFQIDDEDVRCLPEE